VLAVVCSDRKKIIKKHRFFVYHVHYSRKESKKINIEDNSMNDLAGRGKGIVRQVQHLNQQDLIIT